MSLPKRVFLLSKAIKIESDNTEGTYDGELQLNVVSSTDRTPLVLSGQVAPTHSKTNQRPGDDDPDPGQDKCY